MSTHSTALRLTGLGAAAAVLLAAGPVLACHPQGIISKGVTNVTAGNTSIDAADTTGAAITAKPGDTLKYTIVIKNDAPTANSSDDLVSTKLTDTLPTGVELVSGQVTEDLGTVKAQKSVTREITVKVSASAKDGDILDNKACFAGEATDHSANGTRSGCDHAIVKVVVSTPAPTPTPTPTPTPAGEGGETLGTSTEAPTVLPETGTADLLGSLVGMGAMTGAAVAYRRSRRAVKR